MSSLFRLAPASSPPTYSDLCEACGADWPGGGLCDLCTAERDPANPAPTTLPFPSSLRIYRTPSGYAIYGSDAEVAGPILGREPAYPVGDFTATIQIDPGTLAAAVAELARAGETVRIFFNAREGRG